MALAGLAGTSSHMISATVQVLTRLVHHLRNELSQEFTEQLYQTILILFTTKNREIVKSCLGFVKTTCSVLSEEILQKNLKPTIENIFLWINESKNRFRSKIKLILQKFISRCGYEEMRRIVPEEHHKLLASVRRDMARNEKDKSKDKEPKLNSSQKQQQNNNKKKDSDDIDMSDDSDSDDDMDSDDEFIDQFRMEPTDNQDDDDEVLDLLDPKASKLFKKDRKIKKDDKNQFKKDKQGRLVIEDDNEEMDEKEKPVPKSIHQIVTEKGGSLAPTRGKRSRLVDIDDDDDESGNAAPPRKRQKTNDGEKYTGKEYRSKKGSGDVKVSGRHEPFAYLALNPQQLNKRYFF